MPDSDDRSSFLPAEDIYDTAPVYTPPVSRPSTSEEHYRRMFVGSLVTLCVSGRDTIPYDLVDVTEHDDRTEVTLDLKFPYQYVRDDREVGQVGRVRITIRTEDIR